jgi:hypothetical protein
MWRRLADFRGSFGPLGSFDGITDIVVKHEGLVDKIISDECMHCSMCRSI